MLCFNSLTRLSGSALRLRMRIGLFPWLISATRTFSITAGTDACMTSSRVSATAENMSGLIRPQTTARKVFIHSTDSGRRLAVAYLTVSIQALPEVETKTHGFASALFAAPLHLSSASDDFLHPQPDARCHTNSEGY